MSIMEDGPTAEAPAEVFEWPDEINALRNGRWWSGDVRMGTRYVRADIHDRLHAALAELVEATHDFGRIAATERALGRSWDVIKMIAADARWMRAEVAARSALGKTKTQGETNG